MTTIVNMTLKMFTFIASQYIFYSENKCSFQFMVNCHSMTSGCNV